MPPKKYKVKKDNKKPRPTVHYCIDTKVYFEFCYTFSILMTPTLKLCLHLSIWWNEDYLGLWLNDWINDYWGETSCHCTTTNYGCCVLIGIWPKTDIVKFHLKYGPVLLSTGHYITRANPPVRSDLRSNAICLWPKPNGQCLFGLVILQSIHMAV